jgi:phosphoserine phosphatase
MPAIIIHSTTLSDDQRQIFTRQLGGELKFCGTHFRVENDAGVTSDTLEALRAKHSIDINVLPEGFNADAVQLLVSDMDSTLINIECVDEIADFVGLKPQVSAITEAAMRGELDFADSLRKRVALLEGLEVSALQRVYDERLELNPGAEELLAGLKARSIKMALASGGFTFFTEHLRSRLNLDYTLANVLAEENGKLKGSVTGDIIGAEAKAEFLKQVCESLAINPDQVIAMGDGANDLQMLGVAGLGVAYHANPAVREQADTTIQYGGLNKVLDFLPVMNG